MYTLYKKYTITIDTNIFQHVIQQRGRRKLKQRLVIQKSDQIESGQWLRITIKRKSVI